MRFLKQITPPTKRHLRLISDKAYSLAKDGQPGLYMIDTATGETELNIVNIEEGMYFAEDGRAFPDIQVLGRIFSRISEVSDANSTNQRKI